MIDDDLQNAEEVRGGQVMFRSGNKLAAQAVIVVAIIYVLSLFVVFAMTR